MFYQLGLIGYPLAHSLSPRIHSAAFQALGLAGEYRLYPVQPLPDGQAILVDLLNRLRSGALQGLNVTIPHKQGVISYLDELTPAARGIGAVNTVYSRDRLLIGENTDAAGFEADLARTGILQLPPDARLALVLGAGGGARAVVYALAGARWRVLVSSRRMEAAQALVESMEPWIKQPGDALLGQIGVQVDQHKEPVIREPLLRAISLRELPPGIRLIVNATPLGMLPESNTSPWPADLLFPTGAFVYDLVYNPPETALIRAARQAGLAATGGLGMLVEQAGLSFERWTGNRPPIQALWEAVR